MDFSYINCWFCFTLQQKKKKVVWTSKLLVLCSQSRFHRLCLFSTAGACSRDQWDNFNGILSCYCSLYVHLPAKMDAEMMVLPKCKNKLSTPCLYLPCHVMSLDTFTIYSTAALPPSQNSFPPPIPLVFHLWFIGFTYLNFPFIFRSFEEISVSRQNEGNCEIHLIQCSMNQPEIQIDTCVSAEMHMSMCAQACVWMCDWR